MLSVADAFSVEERDSTRSISTNLQVAWKKDYRPGIVFFQVGVSSIGGNDIIQGGEGVTSDWNKYLYQEETDNIMFAAWERELNQPMGGVTKALAEVRLDNTTGRYTPRYAGGDSELFTAVALPRRPFNLQAGFNYDGIDHNIAQFIGVTTDAPRIDKRSRTIELKGADFIDYLQNRYVDNESMFTGLRSDQVIEQLLINSGFSTSQYDLDYGINLIPFGEFQVGQRFGDIIQKIVQAENAIFWQDEEGRLRFQNRQAWDNYPYFNVQRIITTPQVIEARTPDRSHLINVVEVKAKPRTKQPAQLMWQLQSPLELPSRQNVEMFVNFDDPMLEIYDPGNLTANIEQDGSGTDIASYIQVKSISKFARACKIVFYNNYTSAGWLTGLTIFGRPARVAKDIYLRAQDDSSVTAYEQQPLLIENDYINSQDWANSYAQMILNDYSEPENLQEIVIRAIPELQLGDLISWQGRYWRVFGIKSKVDPASGFVQELKLLQRTIKTYFRIGISVIGGADMISP